MTTLAPESVSGNTLCGGELDEYGSDQQSGSAYLFNATTAHDPRAAGQSYTGKAMTTWDSGCQCPAHTVVRRAYGDDTGSYRAIMESRQRVPLQQCDAIGHCNFTSDPISSNLDHTIWLAAWDRVVSS